MVYGNMLLAGQDEGGNAGGAATSPLLMLLRNTESWSARIRNSLGLTYDGSSLSERA